MPQSNTTDAPIIKINTIIQVIIAIHSKLPDS